MEGSPKSHSPNGRPEEQPGDNPEIIAKQESKPMDQNGDIRDTNPEEESKMHRKESMEEPRRRSRSYSQHSGERRRVSRSQSPRSGSRSPPRRGGSPRRSGSRGSRRMSPAGKGDAEFTQVYVSGLSRNTQQEDLEKIFEECGTIRGVVMKRNYAFIDFKNHADAQEAIKRHHGRNHFGEPLTVEQSLPNGGRRRRTTGPQTEDECWHCGKRGHWANECRARGGRPRRRSGSRDRRSRSPRDRYDRRGGPGGRRSRSRSGEGRSRELREGRCFLCNEKGHIKRNCPEFRGGGGGGRPPFRRFDDRRGGGGRRYSPRSRSRSRSYERRPMYNRRGGGRRDSRSRSPPHRGSPRRSPPRGSPRRSPPRGSPPRGDSPQQRYRGGGSGSRSN